MPRPKRIETGESIYSHMGHVRPDPETKPPEIRTMIGEDTMQKIHHVVRTISLDNQEHESGSKPFDEVESAINNSWLSQGWQVLSVSVLRTGATEAEILYTLVRNVP